MRAHDELSGKELRRQGRERFATAKRLEAEYMRSLRQLTTQIDHMVKGMSRKGVVGDTSELQAALRQYAFTIRPWARSIAEKMLARISYKDEKAWADLGKEMGRELRKEIQTAPTGEVLRRFLDEQVHLITGLPIKAAERVHKLTLEGITEGGRHLDLANEILRTGAVTEAGARCIARTEIARTASGLTMARALHVGSTHYVWRTAHDVDVRESHKKMDGAVIPWATAPILSDGTQTHAGMIYNCRCWASPILTED